MPGKIGCSFNHIAEWLAWILLRSSPVLLVLRHLRPRHCKETKLFMWRMMILPHFMCSHAKLSSLIPCQISWLHNSAFIVGDGVQSAHPIKHHPRRLDGFHPFFGNNPIRFRVSNNSVRDREGGTAFWLRRRTYSNATQGFPRNTARRHSRSDFRESRSRDLR